jgi:hypothetical protein
MTNHSWNTSISGQCLSDLWTFVRTFAVLYCWVLVLAVSGTTMAQGPSSSAPEQSLAVRTLDPLPNWVDELQRLDAQLRDRLREFDSDPPKLSGVAEINEAYETTVRMARLARRLTDVREVAGADFQSRAESAQKRLKKWADQVRQDPDFSRVQSRIRKDFVTTVKNREKKLGKVRTLGREGDWESADEALADLLDDLSSAGLWLDSALLQQGLEVFETDRRDVARGLNRFLQEKLSESVADSPVAQAPHVESLSQRIEQAVLAYRMSPEVSFEGEVATGPGLVRKFFEKWSDLQMQLLRHAAAGSYQQKPRAIAAEQALDTLADRLPALLEDLTRADSARGGNREDLRRLYAGYIESLSPIAARMFDENRVASLQNALAPLANHPEIREEVQGYRMASDAVLTWRQRVAEAQVPGQSGDTQPLDQLVQSSWRDTSGREEAFRWTNAPGEVADPLDQLLPFLGRGTVGKSTRVKAIDASQSPNRLGETIVRSGLYSVVSIPQVAPASIAGLRRDLLVDDNNPPLTLRAAAALWSLEHGCVSEIGGQITEVTCEAVAPTWLNLTRQNTAYLPVGSQVSRDFRSLDKSICLKVMLQPTWLRYGALFVRLR